MKFLLPSRLLLTAVIWLAAAAAESTGDGAPPLYRYLIVVDTSSSMSRQKDGAADALGKLVATGINGRIQTGDLLGMWTIGDRLNRAAFGPKLWNDADRPVIAGRVLAVVRDAKTSKPANLEIAIAAIKDAARASGALTVFLVTDGTAPVTGTPFDNDINEVFRGHSAAMKKAKSPFILVLNAQNGELVSQAISPGGAKIYIPPIPKPATDLAMEQELFGIKRPETNAVAPAAAKTEAPKTLSVAEISEILKKQQAARTNVTTAAAPAVNENGPSDSATPSEPKPAPTSGTAASATAVVTNAVGDAPPFPVAAAGGSPEPAAPVPKPAASDPATAPVESSRPVAAVPSEAATPAPGDQHSAVVLTVSPSALSRRYLMMAGGLFVVALLLGWLLIRWCRPRSSPSLITRSLRERERR